MTMSVLVRLCTLAMNSCVRLFNVIAIANSVICSMFVQYITAVIDSPW